MSSEEKNLWSIGHSNLQLEAFVSLLVRYGIQVVADVRSQPGSKFSSQFDREAFQEGLQARGIKYVFLGKELGGRPKGNQFYDQEGHVLYSAMAVAPFFQEGLERLKEGARKFKVAMVCSEENPRICHRHLLISKVLLKDDFQIQHIRSNGTVESAKRLEEENNQMALFPGSERAAWRSLQSVSQKRAQSDSLNY